MREYEKAQPDIQEPEEEQIASLPVYTQEAGALRSDIDRELAGMADAEPVAGEAAEPDTEFELHGPEDEQNALKDEVKTGGEDEPEEVLQEEQVRGAVLMLENFDGREEIDTEKDEELTAVVESIDEYVALTSREALVDKRFGSIDNDQLDRAAAQLIEVEKACEDYLKNTRPFFRPGRKRKATVNALREEVEELKDDREGLKKCYEDSYLDRAALRDSENTSDKGMGDDDGGEKKIEFSEEGDVKQTDLNAYKGLNEFSADKKADEVKLSESAREQINMIKAIGLVFGVTDWEAITDPEELLYREAGDSVSAAKVNIVPGLKNRLASKVTEEEGRRLADSFKGDTHMIKAINGLLTENSDLVRKLETATGISKKVIAERIKSIRRYLAEAAKGERGRA